MSRVRVFCLATLFAGCGSGSSTPTVDAQTIDSGPGSPDSAPGAIDAAGPGRPDASSVEELCVNTINDYRASVGLGPYARWTDAESCAAGEAMSDAMTGVPHGAFPSCGEFAQNECPGWGGPPADAIRNCLAQMWAEGPGTDFSTQKTILPST